MPSKKATATDLPPDRRPLTEMQASRLSAMTGLDAKSLTGATIAEISDKFRWQIDPELLLFRRICGRVVKKDPATGTEYPVPFATVHVEDTDCSLLGLFPVDVAYSWFFPIFCRREEIGATKTDACGRFCVWVPRWEIDWILRFRRERICFPDIFLRPSIRDILEGLRPPQIMRPPRPLPDPPPFLLKDGGLTLRRAEQVLGADVANKLAGFEAGATFGASTAAQSSLLDGPAFSKSLPPPLPPEFKNAMQNVPAPGKDKSKDRNDAMEAARSTLAAGLNLKAEQLANLDFSKFIGPFLRCFDIFIPEWVPILDVPDITFRVTQDVDGDGTEEVIYHEGFFDVRWNAGAIPDVTLVASPIAVAGRICDPPSVPCAETPAVLFAGRHPLVNPAGPVDPYYDAASGYARRPNRPHPSGNVVEPLPHPLAQTPFAGDLSLYGCNRIKGAVFYRLRYRFNGGPLVPFVGLTWPLYRVVGGSLQSLWPVSDANGWYPVLPAADNWFPDLLLLDWPTWTFADGLYTVQLEIGNGAKSVIGTSTTVGFRIDNSVPSVQFTQLRWKKTTEAGWHPLPLTCAVIPRGVVPADINIEVSYQVSASHLRSVVLSGGGCGGGNPVLTSPLSTAQHWYTNPLDNSVVNTATFFVPAADPAGAYSFSLFSASRAFNPSGGDGGQLADWNYDPTYLYVIPSLPVAIVNA